MGNLLDGFFDGLLNPDPDIESIFFNTDPSPAEPPTDLRSALKKLREEIDAENAERQQRIEAAAREARLKDMGLILSRDMTICEPSRFVPAGQAYVMDTRLGTFQFPMGDVGMTSM